MLTDIEIARKVKPELIEKIASKIGINKKDLFCYGEYIAKVVNQKPAKKQGKLIVVTAINPTKSGNGKTTVAIGLADAISMLNKKTCLALREPSLGPVFGMKGGATGGGYSQIVPMEDINLHFTGDFHAITSANNLLCSYVDNHIFQGNNLNIDPNKILVNRCLDTNERELRNIVLASGRIEKFNITAASEVMAILCVAQDIEDLKNRLGNIMVALTKDGKPVFAKDLNAQESMAILLKNAIFPNLVQTLAGTPAFVHGGPFANIAHGCNSIVATRMALSRADFVVTEAGFGADLGLEKFIDFKCRIAGLKPDAVVLVATLQSVREHGIENLIHHVNVIKNVYNLPVVVTLNKFVEDREEEIMEIKKSLSVEVVENNVWLEGGRGGKDLAEAVLQEIKLSSDMKFAYNLTDSVEEKILKIVKNVYGGKSVEFSSLAKSKIKEINKLKLDRLPVIMAKTQYSLSADKNLLGRPKDFVIPVRDIEIKSGAGFLVVVCGNMLLMPALGKSPAGLDMTIDKNFVVKGLF